MRRSSRYLAVSYAVMVMMMILLGRTLPCNATIIAEWNPEGGELLESQVNTHMHLAESNYNIYKVLNKYQTPCKPLKYGNCLLAVSMITKRPCRPYDRCSMITKRPCRPYDRCRL